MFSKRKTSSRSPRSLLSRMSSESIMDDMCEASEISAEEHTAVNESLTSTK